MPASGQTEIDARIDALEGELRRLSNELIEVRALAAASRATAPRPTLFTTQPATQPRPAPPRPAPPRPPRSRPARPPRPTVADLAKRWDLLGPRGFAIAGGAVTALGIVLLFALAANRG